MNASKTVPTPRRREITELRAKSSLRCIHLFVLPSRSGAETRPYSFPFDYSEYIKSRPKNVSTAYPVNGTRVYANGKMVKFKLARVSHFRSNHRRRSRAIWPENRSKVYRKFWINRPVRGKTLSTRHSVPDSRLRRPRAPPWIRAKTTVCLLNRLSASATAG